MADNYIPITYTNNRLASALRGTVDEIARNLHRLKAIKADMDQMIDGTNYTTLETQFGITNAGDGQLVYNLVSGAITETDADSNLQQLLSWLGAMF